MERTTVSPRVLSTSRRKHADEMRPGMMTDAEIKAELETATGDRLAALQTEREERRSYRATMFAPRRTT